MKQTSVLSVLVAGALSLPGYAPAQNTARGVVTTVSSDGSEVDFRRQVVRGKNTVFEFYADW